MPDTWFMAKTTGNLITLAKHYSDENAARQLLESIRWPNGAACARCGGADPYKLNPKASGKNPARQGLYKCRACKRQFTVTTGTVFESSHVPLSKWVLAVHLMGASKKGMSAHQLHRMLNVTYRAAWFMAHRLRYAMSSGEGLFQKLSGTVEADETYIGGKRRAGRYGYEGKGGRPAPHDQTKTAVVALVERKGRAVAFTVANVTGKTLQSAIRSRVHLRSHMMTDELHGYQGLVTGYAAHDTIKHSQGVYAKGNIHTNTVEGFFALLKRGIMGSFHHVSKAHLHRYCDEFAFRWSNRSAMGVDDGERAARIIVGAEGKRLTYQTSKGDRAA